MIFIVSGPIDIYDYLEIFMVGHGWAPTQREALQIQLMSQPPAPPAPRDIHGGGPKIQGVQLLTLGIIWFC